MSAVDVVQAKVENGQRLDVADALALFETSDLLAVGRLAELANQKIHGDRIFFNRNAHINPTNICVMSCKFCSFARKIGDPGSYAYSVEEILALAKDAAHNGANELHMVGGLHPRWNLSHYLDILSAIKEKLPKIHIKAFTAVEIDWLAKKSRKPHKEVLSLLQGAGMDSMPGGGAEIFHPSCREKLTAKLATEDWLSVHRSAHELGIRSNCTMLYGHIESFAHRVYHMEKLRALQDITGGFNCFIPLAFQPHNNHMGIKRYTFGADDLKTLSIARLFLDNIAQIKAYWVMLGQDIAQIALFFGANDIDGTVVNEKISNMAGSRAGKAMKERRIKSLIWKTGKLSQQRDTLYSQLGTPERYEAPKLASWQPKEFCNKLRSDADIALEDWEVAAYRADFFRLAKAAERQHIHSRQDPGVGYVQAQRIDWQGSDTINVPLGSKGPVVLELGLLAPEAINSITFDNLLTCIDSLRKKDHALEINGFRALWLIAQAAELSFGELVQEIAPRGVRTICSSVCENESDLTDTEIISLHRQAHASDVPTVAAVQLCAPALGGLPLWRSFIKRLLALDQLSGGKQRGLLGASLMPTTDSWISAYEYLRAVALARLILRDVNIIAPLAVLPTAQDILYNPSNRGHPYFRGQEKYAPLCCLVGANDFGWMPNDSTVLQYLREEACSVGTTIEPRDFRFERLDNDSQAGSTTPLDLRHAPHTRKPAEHSLRPMSGDEVKQAWN